MSRHGPHGRIAAAPLALSAVVLVAVQLSGCPDVVVDAIERSDAGSGDGSDGTDDADAASGCRPGFPGDCAAGQRCQVAGCGAGAVGTCVTLADPCASGWEPECGCDGRTYWNLCELTRAGAAGAHPGPCAGTECFPAPGGECPGDLLCARVGCEGGTPSMCVVPPSVCGTGTAPLCGCDRVTYPDACEMFGNPVHPVPLDYEGECAEPPPCAPECRDLGGGDFAWVDPCGGAEFCRVDCNGCESFCSRVGYPDEGWYVRCVEPSRDAGCGPDWNLIAWRRCSAP